MQQPLSDPWLDGMMAAGAFASGFTWLVLVARCWRGPFLHYEARQPVPWGAAAALLAVLLVLLALASGLGGGEHEPPEAAGIFELVQQIVAGFLLQAFIIGVFFGAIVAVSGATQRDLGLPEFVHELGRDVRIGAVAWLAALLPVFGLQAVLVSVLDHPTKHPLVQMVTEEPHPLLLVFAFVAAVVVAPVCEEIAFRLLLQGWLEKWEDGRFTLSADVNEPERQGEGETRRQGDEENATMETSPCLPVSLSPCLFPGLPHGWLPILVSSVLFSLAHYGHGPDPIPLLFLAVILGYTYQRTHRIVPCIVTHMLFNLLTLVALGRIVYISSH